MKKLINPSRIVLVLSVLALAAIGCARSDDESALNPAPAEAAAMEVLASTPAPAKADTSDPLGVHAFASITDVGKAAPAKASSTPGAGFTE